MQSGESLAWHLHPFVTAPRHHPHGAGRMGVRFPFSQREKLIWREESHPDKAGSQPDSQMP